MEIEYFIKPGDEEKVHKEFEKNLFSFLYDVLKINTKENFRLRWHEKEELSHYSSGTFDIEYHFPFGWSELWGCASRTDFDLKQHEKFSGKDLKYLDPYTNEKYTPYVIEPSFGLNRTLLMVLLDAYHEIKGENGETRTVLKLAPNLAPYTVAVLPLVKAVSPYAEKVFDMLTKDYICDYDESGSIGKRYARQDEIGTPFCITIDYDTCQEGDNPNPKNKDTVTVRMRDSGEQVRVALDSLKSFLNEHC
jgi:glycyl-tRNA synthetase